MARFRRWIKDRIRQYLWPYRQLFPYFPHHHAAHKLLPPQYSRTLDVGCGDGRWIRNLHGEKVGLEIDKAESVKAKNRSNRVLGSAQHLPFRNRVFDLVTFLEVMQYLDNPTATLREINYVLKEGGYLILTTPNLQDPVQILFNFAPSKVEPSNKPFEIHRGGWDFLTLRSLLSHTGFEIERRAADVIRPFPWSIGKMLAYLFPAFSYHIAVRARKHPNHFRRP